MPILVPPFPPVPPDERNAPGLVESFPAPADVRFAAGYGADEADLKRGYLAVEPDYSPEASGISPVNPARGGFLIRSPLPLER